MLIIVRVFLGVGLGIASSTAPVYLSEMSPKNIRGRLIYLSTHRECSGLCPNERE